MDIPVRKWDEYQCVQCIHCLLNDCQFMRYSEMGVMPSTSTSLIAQYYCPKSHQGCTFIPSLCRFKNDFHHALISVDPCWVVIHSQHGPQKNMQWMIHHLTIQKIWNFLLCKKFALLNTWTQKIDDLSHSICVHMRCWQ